MKTLNSKKTAIKQTSCVEILIHTLSCLQIILHPCLGYFPFGQFLIVWYNCLQCFVAHGNAGSPLGIRLSPPDSHWYGSSDHVLNRSLKQIQQDLKKLQVQILYYYIMQIQQVQMQHINITSSEREFSTLKEN